MALVVTQAPRATQSAGPGIAIERVGQVMSRRLLTVGMDDSLSVVRDLFRRNRGHHLLVVEGKKLVGVISDRDMLRNVSPFIGNTYNQRPQDLATLNRKVHQIMTRKLVTIGPDLPLPEAARLMLEHGISCLPISHPEDGRPLGVVTRSDLLKAMMEFKGLATRGIAHAQTEEDVPPAAAI